MNLTLYIPDDYVLEHLSFNPDTPRSPFGSARHIGWQATVRRYRSKGSSTLLRRGFGNSADPQLAIEAAIVDHDTPVVVKRFAGPTLEDLGL